MASGEIINSLEFIRRIKFYPNYSPGELTRILKHLTRKQQTWALRLGKKPLGNKFGKI